MFYSYYSTSHYHLSLFYWMLPISLQVCCSFPCPKKSTLVSTPPICYCPFHSKTQKNCIETPSLFLHFNFLINLLHSDLYLYHSTTKSFVKVIRYNSQCFILISFDVLVALDMVDNSVLKY